MKNGYCLVLNLLVIICLQAPALAAAQQGTDDFAAERARLAERSLAGRGTIAGSGREIPRQPPVSGNDPTQGTDDFSDSDEPENPAAPADTDTGTAGDHSPPDRPARGARPQPSFVKQFYDPECTILQARGVMVAGLKSGEWTYFHRNGEIASTGRYQFGQKHGQWVYRNVAGKIIRVDEYNFGELLSSNSLE